MLSPIYDLLFCSGVPIVESLEVDADISICAQSVVIVCVVELRVRVPACVCMHSCCLGRIGYGLKFGFSLFAVPSPTSVRIYLFLYVYYLCVRSSVISCFCCGEYGIR